MYDRATIPLLGACRARLRPAVKAFRLHALDVEAIGMAMLPSALMTVKTSSLLVAASGHKSAAARHFLQCAQ